jgi:hypothetical protein
MTEPWRSPSKPWRDCSAARQEQLHAAWSAGELTWKLDPVQKEIVKGIYASHATVKSSLERVYILDLSRRQGKDFIMAAMATMTAMRNDKGYIRIPYAALTREDAQNIIVPIFETIFQDCPPELLPYELKRGTFRTNSPELNFENGAQIALIGVELHPERLRGTSTYAAFGTELAFADDLEYLLSGVILPQLLTHPDGFVVLGSTPPVTPAHYWSTDLVPQAQARKMYVRKTVYDNPRITEHDIRGAIASCGGEKTTKFRREYLAEHVVETTLAVIPEFVDVEKDIVTTEGFDAPPSHRDTYAAIDPGFAHATGALFAWYDFKTDLVMVEGDFKVSGLNSGEIARRVKAREWQLWGRVPVKPGHFTEAAWQTELEMIRLHFYPGLTPPTSPVVTWNSGQPYAKTYRRVSDNDSRLIADLQRDHDLLFFASEKDNSEAHLNNFRLQIAGKRWRIHPRCVNFIADLKHAIWNKSRTNLAEQKGGMHFDTIPAAKYLNRSLVRGRNPFPGATYDPHTHHIPKTTASSRTKNALVSAFTRRKR